MTCIRTALESATAELLHLPEGSARLEAELLLAEALEQTRTYLFAWPEREIGPTQEAHFQELLARRLRGEPLAYILGRRGFWTLNLKVAPGVLIPRPETELLVELALAAFPSDKTVVAADLGTGSGAIAAALASERPAWRLFAVDLSEQSLAVARENFRRLRLANVVCFAGNWCESLPPDLPLDLAVSNPPYVPERDPHLARGDLRHEPRSALAAGEDGLDAVRALMPQVGRRLRPGGLLLLEHGRGQGPAVRRLLVAAGFDRILSHRDLAGLERVAEARKPV
jgi:release factor glutamine methyltransferase